MAEAVELTESLEDYLEAIYRLLRDSGTVRVKEIAEMVGVKMPSVSSALAALKERGLVEHERYGQVTLTPAGRETAEFLCRRHYALIAFLRDILGIEPDQAETEAGQIEHALSPESLRRLLMLLDFIERCPRGGEQWLEQMLARWENPPCERDCAECIAHIEVPESNPFASRGGTENSTTLDRLSPGKRGKVLRLSGEPQIRRRLMDMGLTPGAEIEVERLAPLGDPIEIEVRGYHLSLRKREAAGIAVE
ncbi:MAG TPA: DtxR family transcriptional regulator, partial [Armatimonadetes bacterium]|nr:DtxR family transcriptional regulator [Armatimonadota bacterium]